MSDQLAFITGIRPGLQVREVTGCNERKSTVADWLCSCGHHERASGQDVTALVARATVGHCPHTTATKEAA